MAEMRKIVLLMLLSVVSSVSGSLRSIPALIWTSDQTHQFKPVLAGHSTSSDVFHKDYLKHLLEEKHNIVVFLQDKLSLDDINEHADVYSDNNDGSVFNHLKDIMGHHSSVHLPRVAAPLQAVEKLKREFAGKVLELKAPYDVQNLGTEKGESNMVVVHLPAANSDEGRHKTLGKTDDVIGSVSSQLNSLGLNYAAVYTGRESSYLDLTDIQVGRHLLETDEKSTQGTFYQVKNCTLFYSREVVFEIRVKSGADLVVKLPPQNETMEGECDGGFGTLDVNFTEDELKSTNLTSLSYTLEFTIGNISTTKGFWYMNQASMTYEANLNGEKRTATDVVLRNKDIYAPYNFSYHCKKASPLAPQNTSSDVFAQLRFNGLQVEFKTTNDSFSRANDCAEFFTIPILAGLFVTLIFVGILAFGIQMVANINTMDRFEDPKGKRISVNVSD